MPTNNWTRAETIVAFNLYCKIPFQRAYSNNPLIIEVATIIGRSPNSVKMRIGNFGSFDPELAKQGIVGLTNASRLDKEVWDEFNNDWETLAFESERLIAEFRKQSIDDAYIDDSDPFLPIGAEREQIVKTRVNQAFFRSAVLSAYENRCCITGLPLPQLLIASHIKPWKDSDEKSERTNPRNGLSLNALHDKAFDLGFITIDTDFSILISRQLHELYSDNSVCSFFKNYENAKIQAPSRFAPDKAFLEYHNDVVFRR